jgi:hypothetical protein
MITTRFHSSAVIQSAWRDQATGILLPIRFMNPPIRPHAAHRSVEKTVAMPFFPVADTDLASRQMIPPPADPTGDIFNAHRAGSSTIVPAA